MRAGAGPVLALLLLGAGLARAGNGPHQSVIGNKGPVTLPVDGDAHSQLRMPSAIGWTLDHRIELDLFLLLGRSTFRNALNDLDQDDAAPAGSLAVVLAPGRVVADGQGDDELGRAYGYDPTGTFTLGIGLFVDQAGGSTEPTRVRAPPFLPNTVGLYRSIQFLTMPLTLAWTPRPWLSLGASLHLTYVRVASRSLIGSSTTPLEGSPTISGVPIPGNPTYADFLNLFQSDAASDPTTQVTVDTQGFQFGAALSCSLRPHPRFGLGLSWRPRSWAPLALTGEAKIDATTTFGAALNGLSAAVQNLFLATLPQRGAAGYVGRYDVEVRGLYTPQALRASLAFYPALDEDDWRLLIGAEVAWVEWHRALRATKVELTDGDNADLSFVIGSDQVRSTVPLGFRSTWVWSLYAAFMPLEDLSLRVGVNYARSPLDTDYQDLGSTLGWVETNLSLGAAYTLWDVGPGRLELACLVEYGLPKEVRAGARVSVPSARGSRYSSEQVFLHLGVSYAF